MIEARRRWAHSARSMAEEQDPRRSVAARLALEEMPAPTAVYRPLHTLFFDEGAGDPARPRHVQNARPRRLASFKAASAHDIGYLRGLPGETTQLRERLSRRMVVAKLGANEPSSARARGARQDLRRHRCAWTPSSRSSGSAGDRLPFTVTEAGDMRHRGRGRWSARRPVGQLATPTLGRSRLVLRAPRDRARRELVPDPARPGGANPRFSAARRTLFGPASANWRRPRRGGSGAPLTRSVWRGACAEAAWARAGARR